MLVHWRNEKIQAQIATVDSIKDYVVISGGLAWHFMSPPHQEVKKMHDHSDVDLFVIPNYFQTVVSILKGQGFTKQWTKYDGLDKNFIRYSNVIGEDKVLLDLFIETVPYQEIDGYKIITVEALLPMYETKHASKECVAVQAAMKLVEQGIDPTRRTELITIGEDNA